jgi:hypothetical protein
MRVLRIFAPDGRKSVHRSTGCLFAIRGIPIASLRASVHLTTHVVSLARPHRCPLQKRLGSRRALLQRCTITGITHEQEAPVDLHPPGPGGLGAS